MIPYQSHSETSRQAALNTNADRSREEVFDIIDGSAAHGMTIDEVAVSIDKSSNAVSGRFIELQRDKRIIKTAMKRPTSSNKPGEERFMAFVYVSTKHWISIMGMSNQKEKSELELLKEENNKLKKQIEELYEKMDEERYFNHGGTLE